MIVIGAPAAAIVIISTINVDDNIIRPDVGSGCDRQETDDDLRTPVPARIGVLFGPGLGR